MPTPRHILPPDPAPPEVRDPSNLPQSSKHKRAQAGECQMEPRNRWVPWSWGSDGPGRGSAQEGRGKKMHRRWGNSRVKYSREASLGERGMEGPQHHPRGTGD